MQIRIQAVRYIRKKYLLEVVLTAFGTFSPSSDSNGNKFGELGYQMNRKSGWRVSGQQEIRVKGSGHIFKKAWNQGMISGIILCDKLSRVMRQQDGKAKSLHLN